jgi:hypothetical protein
MPLHTSGCDTTLGVLVLGLKSQFQRMDNQSMRQVGMESRLIPYSVAHRVPARLLCIP